MLIQTSWHLWRQALLAALSSCPGVTQGMLARDCNAAAGRAERVLPAARAAPVLLGRIWARARRGLKLHAFLELGGGEEEDGFPGVLPADLGGRGKVGFRISLTP